MNNKLKFILLKDGTIISLIKFQKGQVIYDKSKSTVYIDSYNLGRIITTKIQVVELLDEIGIQGIVYYNSTDNKFYIYNKDSKIYTEVSYLTEILHLIEPVSTYRATTMTVEYEDASKQNQRSVTKCAPVTLTNLIYRPTGENLEVYLKDLMNKASNSGVVKSVIVDSDTSFPMVIPVPFKDWFLQGGTSSVYVDGVFVPPDKYEIDEVTSQITFKDFPAGLPTGTKVEFGFLDTLDNYEVYKNRFISTKGQRDFVLDFVYTPGMNSIEVYVNGTKQPDECYTETDQRTVTLNATIPENSEVLIQAGKLVPSSLEFYDDFESRTISAKKDNMIITTYPKNSHGQIRSIEETFDNNNRVILRVAKVNGIEVKRETLNYQQDGSVVITAQ